MRGPFNFLFFIVFFLFLLGCSDQRANIDVSENTEKLLFKRYDIALFETAKEGLTEKESNELAQNYPEIHDLFAEGVMGFSSPHQEKGRIELGQFIENEDINGLFNDVVNQFGKEGISPFVEEFEMGFKRLEHLIPNQKMPHVCTFVSGFRYAIIVNDSLLGLGLDMYLGGEYPHYAEVGIPKYKFKNFHENYLVSDALKAWILTEFELKPGSNLLEQMVYQGKINYLLKMLLPEVPEYIFFNYNREEIEWCEKNEKEVWFHLVEMELLYNSELEQIRKFMGDTPFIPGFPEGSPGKVGHWLGYKIVSAYMNSHPDVTVEELMSLQDANRFLQQSKYKPEL